MTSRLILLFAIVAVAGLVLTGQSIAQAPAAAPKQTAEQKAAEKKQLAECRSRAKETKLSFKKRRKFVDDCMAAAAPR
jgi:hypothetical protein